VATWHAAKGLEWPVVVVCGMHRPIEPRFPSIAVNYEDFRNPGAILNRARVEIVPRFPAEETQKRVEGYLRPALEEEARRLLYVALTRARETLVLEWPGYLEGGARLTPWSLLCGGGAVALEGEAMRVGSRRFPCVVTRALPGPPPEPGVTGAGPSAPLPVVGRRALREEPLPGPLVPEALAPSALRGEPGAAGEGLVVERYGPPLLLDGEGVERGVLWHRLFEALGGRAAREDLVEQVLGAPVPPEERRRMAAAVDAFDRWLARRFLPLRLRREVPLLGLDGRGTVVSGVVDLLVETAGGIWLIDHKTDLAPDRPARFGVYLPQLASYAFLAARAFPGLPVLGVGIHWVSYWEVTLLPHEGRP